MKWQNDFTLLWNWIFIRQIEIYDVIREFKEFQVKRRKLLFSYISERQHTRERVCYQFTDCVLLSRLVYIDEFNREPEKINFTGLESLLHR